MYYKNKLNNLVSLASARVALLLLGVVLLSTSCGNGGEENEGNGGGSPLTEDSKKAFAGEATVDFGKWIEADGEVVAAKVYEKLGPITAAKDKDELKKAAAAKAVAKYFTGTEDATGKVSQQTVTGKLNVAIEAGKSKSAELFGKDSTDNLSGFSFLLAKSIELGEEVTQLLKDDKAADAEQKVETYKKLAKFDILKGTGATDKLEKDTGEKDLTDALKAMRDSFATSVENGIKQYKTKVAPKSTEK